MNDNEKSERVEKESPKKIEPPQDDLSALRSALKKEKEDKKLPTLAVEEKKEETKVEEGLINIDSLISSYKEESAGSGPKTDFLVDLLNEEDFDKENQSENFDNESQKEDSDIGIKSTRLSRNFKKDKGAVEKTRKQLVKRSPDEEEDDNKKAAQHIKNVSNLFCYMLLILVQAIGGRFKTNGHQWGVVNFSTKNVAKRLLINNIINPSLFLR